MKHKVLFLFALLVVFFSAILNVEAQRGAYPKYRGSINPSFRRADKLSLFASVGLSAMNSDNLTRHYQGPIGLLKGNGFGPNLNVGAIYQVSPYVGLIGNLEYMHLKGEQDQGKERLANSFSFNSKIASASGSIVVNLASTNTLTRFYRRTFRRGLIIIPYVKAGIGVLHANVSSSVDGIEEEPKIKYPTMAAVFPIGGGFRIRYSNEISFAPELTLNFTPSDYLDNRSGVNANKKDNIATASIKVFYTPSKTKRRWF